MLVRVPLENLEMDLSLDKIVRKNLYVILKETRFTSSCLLISAVWAFILKIKLNQTFFLIKKTMSFFSPKKEVFALINFFYPNRLVVEYVPWFAVAIVELSEQERQLPWQSFRLKLLCNYKNVFLEFRWFRSRYRMERRFQGCRGRCGTFL